jgi:Zn-dependent protease
VNEELVSRLIAAAVIILVGFPVHEFAHAFIANQLGDSTARYQGRLTLNPIAHFDPLGGTFLVLSTLLAGFPIGWAKPTPVNPYNLRWGRRGDVVVALAGPVSNLILAAAVAIPLRLIVHDVGLMAQIGANPALSLILGAVEFFMVINIILAVFNFLPIPPLDGWHGLLGLVDARTAFSLRQVEQYGFILLLLIVFAGGRIIGDIVFGIRNILLGL